MVEFYEGAYYIVDTFLDNPLTSLFPWTGRVQSPGGIKRHQYILYCLLYLFVSLILFNLFLTILIDASSHRSRKSKVQVQK
jgi:hypothetical protein